MSEQKKAVVILSGGLDSTTCMGFARKDGYSLYPLTFDYGQRHIIELESARRVAEYYGVSDRHKVISLSFLKEFGGSALTDPGIEVPKAVGPNAGEQMNEEIPVTYVPGRNLLFLAVAASYAEAIGAEAIYIGVNALDYSGYPDCRPEFIERVQDILRHSTKVGVEGRPILIKTPLIYMTKGEIIRAGTSMNVPYHLTSSCYNGGELACGECDSCRLRLKGFAEAGIADPIPYRKK